MKSLSLLIPFFFFYGVGHAWDQKTDPDNYFDGTSRTPTGISLNRSVPLNHEVWGEGVLATTLGTSDQGARAILLQDRNVILVGQAKEGTNRNFAIVRYYEDGGLDTGFGTAGRVLQSFGAGDDWAHAGVSLPDGKIVVAGRSDLGTSDYDFALLRLTTLGSLDTSFHSDGKVSTNLLGGVDIARAIVYDSSANAVLVAGMSWNGSYFESAFVRYLSDGSLDTTFRTTGKSIVSFNNNDNGALSLALLTSGNIAAGGPAYNGSNWEFGVTRLSSDGTVDTSFNTTGVATFPILASDDRNFALLVQSDGKLVLAGEAYNGSSLDMALLRLSTSGSLDTTFLTSGRGTSNQIYSLRSLFSAEAKLMGAGFWFDGASNQMSVARFTSNGSLDTSFFTRGVSSVSTGNHSYLQSVALFDDASVFAAGRVTNGSVQEMSVVRFDSRGGLARGGVLDSSFGTLGILRLAGGILSFDIEYSALFPDGKILTAGTIGAGLLRWLPTGQLDTAFATEGYNSANTARGRVAVQTDGKSLFLGFVGGNSFNITRLNTNGSFDTTFRTTGAFSAAISDDLSYDPVIFIQTDGKILTQSSFLSDIVIIRFNTNGTYDTSFKTSGQGQYNLLDGGSRNRGSTDIGNAMATDISGRIVIGGYAFLAGSRNEESVELSGKGNRVDSYRMFVRLTTDGSFDTTFGTVGFTLHTGLDTTAAGVHLSIAPDQKILSSGYENTPITRHNSNGTLDTSFATNGYLVVSIPGVGVPSFNRAKALKNGKFIVGSATNNIVIARYLSQGILDTSFGTAGYRTFHPGTSEVVQSVEILPSGKACWFGGDHSASTAFGACMWP